MENFNLGAIVFVLFVGLWLLYAIPQIAERRRHLGEVEAMSQQPESQTARNLTVACKERSSQVMLRRHNQSLSPHSVHGVSSYSGPVLLATGSANKVVTNRKKAGTKMNALPNRGASKNVSAVLTAVLALLFVTTVVLLATTAFNLTSVIAPLISAVLLLAFIAVLRFTRRLRQKSQASSQFEFGAEAWSRDGTDFHFNPEAESWFERAQNLLEESLGSENGVESGQMTASQRHASFMENVLEKRLPGAAKSFDSDQPRTFRYGSVSSREQLENAELENIEAFEAAQYETAKGQVIGHGMTVDEILQRRRA